MADEALKRAQAELNDYLNENPHLKGFQRQIEKHLEELADDPLLRMAFLMRSISVVLREEMIPAMEELEAKLAQIRNEINEQQAA